MNAPSKNPGHAPDIAKEDLKQLWDFNLDTHEVSEDGKRRMIGLRSAAKAMKDAIIDLTPLGRDQSLALTSLEQMLFHGNAAIAREPEETSTAPAE